LSQITDSRLEGGSTTERDASALRPTRGTGEIRRRRAPGPAARPGEVPRARQCRSARERAPALLVAVPGFGSGGSPREHGCAPRLRASCCGASVAWREPWIPRTRGFADRERRSAEESSSSLGAASRYLEEPSCAAADSWVGLLVANDVQDRNLGPSRHQGEELRSGLLHVGGGTVLGHRLRAVVQLDEEVVALDRFAQLV